MQHLTAFISSRFSSPPTVVLLGKGPSFSRMHEFDLSDKVVIALNHTIREVQAYVSHVIDYDVFEACAADIQANADYLLMPMNPHFSGHRTSQTLADLIPTNATLQRLDAENRLIWYNLRASRSSLATFALQLRGYVPVNTGLFSTDTLIEALAKSGVSSIRTLGVDGGEKYSEKFDDLRDKTLLINNQPSFDSQFVRIREHISRYALSYQSLASESPVKVFIGTAQAQLLAAHVLAYSIDARTDAELEFVLLSDLKRQYPQPAEQENRERTPFSFQRFLIPEHCGYAGKAIYLDSDMLVFADILELWNTPMGDADLLSCAPMKSEGRRPHYSVMLMDCECLHWNIDHIVRQLDSGDLTYDRLMNEMAIAANPKMGLDQHWNSLETFQAQFTKLLHYTDMASQPWISGRHPLGHLWLQQLLGAVDTGYINRDLIEEHALNGWVRPSLIHQLDAREVHYKRLPRHIRDLDKAFSPPYDQLINGYTSTANTLPRRLLIRSRKWMRQWVRL